MNPSLFIVLVTVTINMLGVGLAWPILPTLFRELSGGTVSDIAQVYGIAAVAYAAMQFLFAPLLGALSDRYGRRPVMLICLTALGIDNLLLAFAPSIAWAIVARLVGGAFASTISTANAYIADTTSKEDRAKGFGYIGAAFGIGFIIGPLLGGVLGSIDIRLPFLVAAAMSLINVAVGYFYLKETLPPEKRSRKSLALGNPFSSIKWLGKNRILIFLGLASFLATTMQRGLESIWVLFSEVQYGWTFFEAGISLAIVGLSFVFVQGFLIGKVVKRFGEMTVMLTGFCISAVMYLLLSLNTSGAIGFVGVIPHVIGWGCAVPALQALASQQIDETEQGYLQGALTGISGLCAIVGPAAATSVFAYFTSSASPVYLPGAFFMMGSFFLIAAAVMGSYAKPR